MSMGGKQGYKETAIGWIPDGWEPKILSDCAAIIMGQSPAGDTYNSNGIGKPLLNGPTEFTNRYPVKIQWTSSPTKLCQPGDILICVRGSSTGRMNIANDEYCIGRGLASIRYKPGYSQDFLIHLLNHSVSEVLKSAVGSTFPSIDGKAISSISVPTPPLAEQEKIAAILTAVDDKLDVITRQIDTAQTFKQGLMQTLFSRGLGTQSDAGRWVPHTEFKDSELGEIPSGWSVLPLGAMARECRTRNGGNLDDALLCGVLKDQGLVPMRERVKGASTDRCRLVEPDGFAYNPMRINIGSIARNLRDHTVMVSPDYVVFAVKPDVLLCSYLDHFRRSDAWQRFVGRSGDGGVRIRIYFDDLAQLKMKVPPLVEQARIVEVLDCVSEKLKNLKDMQSKFETLKRGLMQKLLTGEWRVLLSPTQEIALAA